MKRILAIALAFLASAALIFGAVLIRSSDDAQAAAREGKYKLSMGTAVTLSSEPVSAAEAAVTTVAVLTDSKGEIVDCVIDCGDFSISFDDVKAKDNGSYKTKGELGDDYGMVAYAGAKYEWYQQAENFANYVKGMNAKDATLLALGEGGKAADADLLSGCTIAISDFKKALVKAMGDTLAISFESEEAPVLSLAMINADSFSEPEENNYPVKMSTSLCAVATVDKKVVAAVTDIAESQFAYDGEGSVTDASYGGTKREILDGYGMKAYSGIGKEWYEQADSFCAYIVGMTAEDIAAIGIGEGGKATDADLTAGCTVAVGGFIEIAKKAISAID